jgi:hypothetical protein
VLFEAETYESNTPALSRTWTLETTPSGYSGTGVMRALIDGGTNTALLTTGPRLEYKINFPTGTANYYIAVLGRDNNGDSIHVGLDSSVYTNSAGQGLTGFNNSSYTWQSNVNGSPTILTNVSGGVHTLKIWMREDGVIIDKIWIGRIAASSPANVCSHPNSVVYEYWGARYERSLTVSDTTTLTFDIASNDGHRLYHNGTVVTDRWNNSTQTSSTTLVLSPGTHTIQVDYYVRTGSSNYINLTYSLQTLTFHSDSDAAGNYPNYYGASLMEEGEIILPANSDPTLVWWDKYEIDPGDSIIIEVSTNGGFDALFGGSSTWTQVYTATSSNTTWTKRVIDLSQFVHASLERRIVVRFRLASLNGSGQADGWWVDDIQIID